MPAVRRSTVAPLAAALLAAAREAVAQHDHAHHAGGGAAATPAARRPAPVSPMLHMRVTELRPAAPGDSARAARLTDAVRRGTARFRDVRAAEREGYRAIFVGDTSVGQVLHYTHVGRGIGEIWRLDPASPGSLLYEVRPNGGRRLVGAMYTAPDRSTPEQLDARVPLAYARWHLHTALCVPKPIWSRSGWARRLDDGRPVFGPESPVATRAECERLGGDFKPSLFGWMVHAMVVDNTRLADVWNEGRGHRMDAMAGAGAGGDPRP